MDWKLTIKHYRLQIVKSYGALTIDPCDRSAREMAQSKAKVAMQLTNGMRGVARRVARP